MSSKPSTQPHRISPPDDIYGWKWFVVYGLAYMILSGLLLAHMIVSDMVSTFIIGAVMLVGAVLASAHARRVRDPETHDCWAMSGLLYCLCGIAVLVEPFIGTRLLTLLLAVGLIISGLSRIVAGAQLQCTAVLLSGAATVIIGIVIGVDWRDHLLWVLGYAIVADIAVQGLTLLVAGEELHLHRCPLPLDENWE